MEIDPLIRFEVEGEDLVVERVQLELIPTGPEVRLEPGMSVIVLGSREQLQAFRRFGGVDLVRHKQGLGV